MPDAFLTLVIILLALPLGCAFLGWTIRVERRAQALEARVYDLRRRMRDEVAGVEKGRAGMKRPAAWTAVGAPAMRNWRLLPVVRSVFVAVLFGPLLLVAGCADDNAWVGYRAEAWRVDQRRMERELDARRQTTDRLLEDARECLALDLPGNLCWGVLAAYRTCLAAGHGDAECRVD